MYAYIKYIHIYMCHICIQICLYRHTHTYKNAIYIRYGARTETNSQAKHFLLQK